MLQRYFDNTLQALLILLAIQLSFLFASATGVCAADNSDIREDTLKISEKLSHVYGFSPIYPKTNSVTEDMIHLIDTKANIYDEQELKVDRSLPYLKAANAVGVITDGKLDSPISYGTAVLISPCHILTNSHVVHKSSINSKLYFSVGQTAYSLGHEFLHENLEVEVRANGNKDIASYDYAIIKIPIITDIEPVVIPKGQADQYDTLMFIGFPYKQTYTQISRFQFPTANFTKVIDSGIGGAFLTKNKVGRPGASGSPVFVADKDRDGIPLLKLGGIFRGGGAAIHISTIFQQIKQNHPEVYEELKAAIVNKSCN